MAPKESHTSLDDLVENQRWLRRLAIAMAGDAAGADDLVQETWEAAGLHDSSPHGPPRAWLRGVLRNRWRMRVRSAERRARREAEASIQPTDELSAEELYARAEVYGLLCELVAALDEPYRTTVLLHYAEDLSADEIAERLDVAASTVRVRLHRAQARLRGGLEKRMGRRRAWAVLATFAVKGGAVKVGGKGIAVALLALLLLGGGGLVWHMRTSASRPGASGGHDSKSAPATAGRASSARAQDELPAWFGEPDRAPRRIAGHVTFAGAPVAGARVALTSAATRAGAAEPAILVTGSDGAFDFGERRAAVWDVTALASGKGYGAALADTRSPIANPRSDALTVRLSGCEHALYGVIRDASGGVVSGVHVFPVRGMWAQTTELGLGVVSDERGAYELCTPAGQIGAIVRAQGYGSVTLWETVVGRHARDVELVPEATVVGRVVWASSGEPIPAARVRLVPSMYRGPVRHTVERTVTDRDGRFRFPGVAPGRHFLDAASDDADAGFTAVVVTPGEESREVILRAEPAAVLRGTVLDGDQPVPWARVGLVMGGRRWDPEDSAVADQAGKFTLTRVPEVAVGFAVEGYEVVSPANYEVMLGERPPVVVQVARASEIRGRVLYRGSPVVDAEVAASKGPGAQPAQTHSDEDGAFALIGLPEGEYTLAAYSYAKGAFSTEAASPRVRLAARERREGVTIELDGEASIAGTVEDQDGKPVRQMVVRYLSTSMADGCDAKTGDDGEFVCRMLAGGADYAPMVLAESLSTIHFPAVDDEGLPVVSVPKKDSRVTGQRLRVRIASATISGRVVTQDGGPYSDVSVFASPASTGHTPANAPFLGFPRAVSDADGAFRVDVWSDVTYNLQALAPGGAETMRSGVKAGTRGVVLRLEEPGRILGTLVGFDRTPDILVRRIGDTVEATPASANGSTFTADGLAAGKYAVFAVAGFQGAGEPVEVAPGEAASLTLRAREQARVRLRVIAFRTGQPVAGVYCAAVPRVPDAPLFGWACPRNQPTDAAGQVDLETPSGSIDIFCDAHRDWHSEGVSHLEARPDADNQAIVQVVVSETTEGYGNGIGARFSIAAEAHGIAAIRSGGASEQAGLRLGDVVATIDGRDVSILTTSGLMRFLSTFEVGTSLDVGFLRNGKARRATVVVEPQPPWSW